MSTKLITQLNPFSTDHNISEIENSSISEIIAKLDKGRAVNTGWRVLLNDEIITDFERQTNDGDTLYVKLVPEGDGSPQSVGKGEKWAGALLTAAGVALLFVPGFGPFAGVALIGAGIGTFANGVLLYNTDFSNPTKDREQPEQSPSIRGSKNQPRPLGYVPILFGKRRIYPDPATNPYTWVDGNGDQYLYQLFCCGQKDQAIDTSSIKIGETPIKEYSSTGSLSSVLNGNDKLVQLSISYGGETPPIVTRCVHEDMYNSVLLHETDDGTDASIIKTTPDDTEEINVDIFFYSGLGQYNDKGEVVEASVEVEVLYKKDSEDNSQYKVLGYFKSDSNTITGKELKTKRYSVTRSGLAKGKYTVKVTRKTNDSKDVKVIDTVFLGSIRSIKNQQPVSKARCRELTLVGLKVKVSPKLNGYVEQLNFVSQAKNQIYNYITEKWTTAQTSNPASAAIYAMQGPLSQQKLSSAEIDWPAFEKLFLWCKENNYKCNEYVYDSISISELLNSIASTCRAEIFRRNGKITVIQDIERDGFVQVFTPRNSWNYKENIIKADIPDALSLQLTDEASNYAQQELKVYNTPDGNYRSEPDTVQDVPLWGVTSNVQARKLGMYKYAVTKNRPIIHNFSCDFEYMLCSKGDWIKYAGDIALAGITQGRISEVIKNADGSIFGFMSDEKIPAMEDEKNYAVRIRLEDGSAVLVGLKKQDKETNLLEFEEDKIINISEGCLFTYGVRGEDSIDLIITDIQCDDDLSASITAVSYSPEIFDIDNPNFVLPDFENRISDIPSVGDSGDISINDLETFVTYHDDFAIPETPLGDGTSKGWHLQKTPYARWQSTKLSKTVDTGKWSAPEQIITRGKSILKVYKEPEEYSSTIDGAIVDFRIKLDDIFESSTIDEVLLGDIIEYSVYHYEVVQRDNLYAYLGTLTSIQGPSGIDGADGKDGSDGNGIKSVAYYYTTTSAQNAPSPESVTNAAIPTLSATNKYLWQKEVITYTKTTTPKITVALIGVYGDKGNTGDPGKNGADGKDGSDGNGISSITYAYATTTSQTVPDESKVTSATIPTLSATNKYLWQKETIKYSKAGTSDKVTVALIGVYGDKGNTGDPGKNGADGKDGSDGNGISSITYAYATTTSQTVPDESKVTSATIPTLSATNKYLWQKETIKYSKAGTSDKVTVALIGVYGDKGATGTEGTKTFYSDYTGTRNWTNAKWNSYTTIGSSNTWLNNTVSGMRVNDILVITGTLTEKGNSKGQLFAKITSIPTAKGSSGYYEIPCSTVSSLIGEKGQTGATGTSISAKGNWANTTAYSASNTVYYPATKRSYICKTSYSEIKAWASGTAYTTSSYVRYTNNIYYHCIKAHTASSSIIPTSTTYWEILTPANTTYWQILAEQGETGAPGEDGIGINSVSYFYAVTKENKIPNADSVTGTSIPSNFDATNRFLWQKEVITYTKINDPKITVALICVYGKQGDRGSKWFSGTAVSGTGDKTITLSEVTHVGDMYMNTSTSDTYICTVGAAASQNSTWSFNGNIKGGSGASVTDVVLSSAIVPITTKIDGKTDDTGTYTINFYGRTGSTAKNVTAVSCSSLPNGLTVTIPTTTTKNSITFLWDNSVDIGNGNTSGDLDLTLTCDEKTIVKKVTWTKVVSKLVVDELLVNKLKSMNFSNIAGQEDGFCFNGTNAEIDLGNGIKVPANTEVHYGNVIYDSDYIKNSDRNLCVALGHLAGYRTRYRGSWNSTVTYTERDVVTYGTNTYWISKSASNKGNTPSHSNSAWVSIDSIDPDSVAIGYEALSNNSYGFHNVAIGYRVLKKAINTIESVAIGSHCIPDSVALRSTLIGANAFKSGKGDVQDSVIIGAGAMAEAVPSASTVITNCIAIGSGALNKAVKSDNLAIGYHTLYNNNSGQYNIAIGNHALETDTKSSNNIAIGHQALCFTSRASGNQACDGNIAIGYKAGNSLQGYYNIVIGDEALPLSADADLNIIIGKGAGSTLTEGDYNILIGLNANTSSATASREINIGNRIFVTGSELYFGSSWSNKALISNGNPSASCKRYYHVSSSTSTKKYILKDIDTNNHVIPKGFFMTVSGHSSYGSSTYFEMVLVRLNYTPYNGTNYRGLSVTEWGASGYITVGWDSNGIYVQGKVANVPLVIDVYATEPGWYK